MMDWEAYRDEYAYKIIEHCANTLYEKKAEWEQDYASYISRIVKNSSMINEVRQEFHEFAPLFLYTPVDNVIHAGDSVNSRLKYQLRYRGTKVATLQYSVRKKHFILKPVDSTLQQFDFPDKTDGSNLSWTGDEARNIRDYFKAYTDSKDIRRKEARYESALITELAKEAKDAKNPEDNKLITGIQPIRLLNGRFQMPTVYSASDIKNMFNSKKQNACEVLPYRGGNGGGIDIMCRVGTWDSHPAIVELKYQNTNSEPLHVALSQALAYAVFIRTLLRSNAASGAAWWKHLFGYTRTLPQKLTIDVVAAMPLKKGECPDSYSEPFFTKRVIKMSKVFGDDEYGDDEFQMHYMFFDIDKSNNDRVTYIKTSLGVTENKPSARGSAEAGN